METVALFAAGVPVWRMLVTPLCLCLVGASLKLACHNCVVPYGSSQYDTTFLATCSSCWFLVASSSCHMGLHQVG
jgi:lipopolysaccharide export LptBFGC system permease protein LptF